MTGMLASVNCLKEAQQVQEAGADIIDLKAPEAGALGALEINEIREIVNRLDADTVISATVGDLPMQPDIIQSAVSETWGAGVDYVKIGLFPGGDWKASIASLKPQTSAGARLIAVFFGDRDPDTKWFPELASAGFSGVMLDTLDKRSGSLRQFFSQDKLGHFISEARHFGFLCGLAGSLRSDDIGSLLELGPDYLGFRGALCLRQNRVGELDPEALRAIREKIR